MSTNWFHNLLFGSNESKVKALEQAQQMDAEQFKSISSALQEFQKAQKIDAEQFQEVFDVLKKCQEDQHIDVERFNKVFSALEDKIGTEQFQSMQEHLNGLQEKVETLTEAVGEQEKMMVTCIIVSAVAAIAITSFVAFCIYQGVKCERKGQEDLASVPGADISSVKNVSSINDLTQR